MHKDIDQSKLQTAFPLFILSCNNKEINEVVSRADSFVYLIWTIFTPDVLPDATPKAFVSFPGRPLLIRQMCEPLHYGAASNMKQGGIQMVVYQKVMIFHFLIWPLLLF